MDVLPAARFLEFFLLGVATPLTAACALPLYPSFITFLASEPTGRGGRTPSVAVLGLLVVGGVLSFLALVGVVVSTLLEASISSVVETVSPVAFVVLAVVGAVLVVSPAAFGRIPAVEPPQTSSPELSAYGYGFFFGAIILSCNPGLIALFFARGTVLFDSTLSSMLGFVAFGLGIGAPLLVFAIVAEPFGQRITRTLAVYSSPIHRGTGLVLVGVSVYYLFVVFAVVPLPF